MEREKEIDRCPNCGWTSMGESGGRDHCPNCLCGIHREDVGYGECGGTLEPVSVWIKEDDCWEIIQRCRLCGKNDGFRRRGRRQPHQAFISCVKAAVIPAISH